jgi:hypothetical protein
LPEEEKRKYCKIVFDVETELFPAD